MREKRKKHTLHYKYIYRDTYKRTKGKQHIKLEGF